MARSPPASPASAFIGPPARLYMQLVAGHEMGSTARWVTVILYLEVARRAFTTLSLGIVFMSKSVVRLPV